MQQTVESNNTIIVDGPASVRLVSGKVEVFGALVKEMKRVLVREGKRLPFFVREKAVFDISLGGNASIDQVIGRSTIPQSWNKPIEAILSAQKQPMVIMILGKIDSGKSSYCTYLINKLVDEKMQSCCFGWGFRSIRHWSIRNRGLCFYFKTADGIVRFEVGGRFFCRTRRGRSDPDAAPECGPPSRGHFPPRLSPSANRRPAVPRRWRGERNRSCPQTRRCRRGAGGEPHGAAGFEKRSLTS